MRLLDAVSGRVVQEIRGHGGTVNSCAFSTDGEQIISCSYDKTVRISNVGNGKAVHTIEAHNAPVLSVAVYPDGGKVVTADTSGLISSLSPHLVTALIFSVAVCSI